MPRAIQNETVALVSLVEPTERVKFTFFLVESAGRCSEWEAATARDSGSSWESLLVGWTIRHVKTLTLGTNHNVRSQKWGVLKVKYSTPTRMSERDHNNGVSLHRPSSPLYHRVGFVL